MLNANEITIKSWFYNKEFSSEEQYAISCGAELSIERETAKVILGKWVTKFGSFTKWLPKSVLVSKEEAKKIIEKQQKETQQRFNDYENLVRWAKEQGIKGI